MSDVEEKSKYPCHAQVPLQGIGPGTAERMLKELLVNSGVMGADAATAWISKSVADLAVGATTDATAHTFGTAAASASPSHIGA